MQSGGDVWNAFEKRLYEATEKVRAAFGEDL